MHKRNRRKSLLILGLVLITLATVCSADSPPVIPQFVCERDDDCSVWNARLSAKVSRKAAYLCNKGNCTYTVLTGEVCKKSSDCAFYHWVTRQLEKNLTLEMILGGPVARSSSEYLSDICNPNSCTIASNCDDVSDPLFTTPGDQLLLPQYTEGQACCSGGPIGSTCTSFGNVISTCDLSGVCSNSANSSDFNQYCNPVDAKANQWVGVIITIIGAAMLNVGLNLQKLALRKRYQKTQEKKMERRMKIIQRLAAVKLLPLRLPSFISKRSRTPSFTNLFAARRGNGNASNVSAAGSDTGSIFNKSRSTTPNGVGWITSGGRTVNTNNGGAGTEPAIAGTTGSGFIISGSPAAEPVDPIGGTPTAPSDEVLPSSLPHRPPADEDAIVEATPMGTTVQGKLRGLPSSSSLSSVPADARTISDASEMSEPIGGGAGTAPSGSDTNSISTHSRQGNNNSQGLPNVGRVGVGGISSRILSGRSGIFRDTLQFGIDLPRPTLRILNQNTIAATVTRPDGTTEDISIPQAPEDKLEFQKNLDFGSLLKNPVWVLGFLVFAFSNVMNFIALQFAPQSLVAPLGSISLVVNVIIAPLINRETWTWRDIVGVVLIVAGSSMTVVFAGVEGKDFQICVLLALFRRTPTIIFLTVTCSLLVFIFLLICFIEKNLDLTARGEITVTHTITASSVAAVPGGGAVRERARKGRAPKRGPKVGLGDVFVEDNTEAGGVGEGNAGVDGGDAGVADAIGTEKQADEVAVQVVVSGGDAEDIKGEGVDGVGRGSEDSGKSVAEERGNGPAGIGTVRNRSRPISSSNTSLTIRGDADDGEGGGEGRRVSATIGRAAGGGDDDTLAADSLPRGSTGGPSAPPSAAATPNKKKSPLSGAVLTVEPESIVDEEGLGSGGGGAETKGAVDTASQGGPAAAAAAATSVAIPVATAVIGLEEAMAEPDPGAKQSLGQRIYKHLPAPIQSLIDWWQRIDILPRLKEKYKPDSRHVRVYLPFSYASIGGLMATLTVLFAKSTIHLLSDSLFQGMNQYDNVYAWIITGVTFVTAVGQIYWINMGLQRYDALLQIPVFYVVWTLFDILGGGIYFREFDGFSARQYGLFSFSVFVIFVGVAVLGDRLKKTSA